MYFEIRENMTVPEYVEMFDEHITVDIEKLDQDTEHFLPELNYSSSRKRAEMW